jgi:hypothetical protein
VSGSNGRDVQLPGVANRTAGDDYGFASMSLEALRNLWRVELADKPGECSCPVIDGVRGFRQKCEVHGGRGREDFRRLTALRMEIISRMRTPESVRAGKARS